MPIKKDAALEVYEVKRIHSAVTDFCAFIQSIRDNVDNDLNQVTNIPARVADLTAKKAKFDAIGIAGPRLTEIMTNEFGYADWASSSSDFAAFFTSIGSLSSTVKTNIGFLTQAFSGNSYTLTASGAARTALINELDAILAYFE